MNELEWKQGHLLVLMPLLSLSSTIRGYHDQSSFFGRLAGWLFLALWVYQRQNQWVTKTVIACASVESNVRVVSLSYL